MHMKDKKYETGGDKLNFVGVLSGAHSAPAGKKTM